MKVPNETQENQAEINRIMEEHMQPTAEQLERYRLLGRWEKNSEESLRHHVWGEPFWE